MFGSSELERLKVYTCAALASRLQIKGLLWFALSVHKLSLLLRWLREMPKIVRVFVTSTLISVYSKSSYIKSSVKKTSYTAAYVLMADAVHPYRVPYHVHHFGVHLKVRIVVLLCVRIGILVLFVPLSYSLCPLAIASSTAVILPQHERILD